MDQQHQHHDANNDGDEDENARLARIVSSILDHRKGSRSVRIKFEHKKCKKNIHRNILSNTPKLKFNTVFRIRKERFDAIYEDIKDSGNTFFFNAKGSAGACPEARILVPLQCLGLRIQLRIRRSPIRVGKRAPAKTLKGPSESFNVSGSS
jgi:hypothetical protein